MREFRDFKGIFDYATETAFDNGIVEGGAKRTTEIAKALKASGVSIDIIISTTGLSKNEIDNL